MEPSSSFPLSGSNSTGTEPSRGFISGVSSSITHPTNIGQSGQSSVNSSSFVPVLPANMDTAILPMVNVQAEQLSQMHQALEGIAMVLPRLTTKGDIDEQTSRLLESFLSLHRTISLLQSQQQQMTLMMGSMLLMLQNISGRLDKLEHGNNVVQPVKTGLPITPQSILVPTEPVVHYSPTCGNKTGQTPQ